jgi:hypothetical protein
MPENAKNMICEDKEMRKSKKSCLSEKYKHGLNKFLGHVSPILDDASDPPGHRDT